MLREAAFSLLEMVVALAVLGGLSSGCYVGFNVINAYAASSRLYSEAQAAAHNQVDLILSRGPFNITVTPYKVPIELMLKSELALLPLPSSPPTTRPALSDPYYRYYPYYRDSNGDLAKQAFVYTDPVSGRKVVTGTLTSRVTDAAIPPMAYGTTGQTTASTPLNVRQASVTVSYNFRNKEYRVSMDTLRAADQ